MLVCLSSSRRQDWYVFCLWRYTLCLGDANKALNYIGQFPGKANDCFFRYDRQRLDTWKDNGTSFQHWQVPYRPMAHPGRIRPFSFPNQYSNLSCHPVWTMMFLHFDVFIPPIFTNCFTLNFGISLIFHPSPGVTCGDALYIIAASAKRIGKGKPRFKEGIWGSSVDS